MDILSLGMAAAAKSVAVTNTDSITDLAGTGRTDETVKDNADDIGTANESLASIAQDLEDLSLTGGAGVTSEEFTAEIGQSVFALTNTNGVINDVHIDTNFQNPSSYTLNEAKNEVTITGLGGGEKVVLGYSVGVEAGGSGTVTQVSSANADISVATGTTTPVLTLNSGTGANQIVKLDGAGKLPAIDGSQLTGISGGGGGLGTLVDSATQAAMRETIVSAVDIDTDTFTATAHGMANNDRIFFTLNTNAGAVYLPNIIPGGCTAATKYYVVNKADNTFQISTSVGGAAVDLTTNASLDLTKWHFESSASDGSSIAVTGLTAKKRYRAIIRGKTLGGPLSYINPNGWDITQSSWNGSNAATTWGSALFMGTGEGNVAFYFDCFFDSKFANGAYFHADGVESKHNNTTANTAASYAKRSFSPVYGGGDITSITLAANSGGAFANGTVLEVYDA